MQAEQMVSAQSVWRQISRLARARISPALYRACFAGTQGIALEADSLVVAVPTATVAGQLERRFAPLLTSLAERVARRPLRLRFTAGTESAAGASLSRICEKNALPAQGQNAGSVSEKMLAPQRVIPSPALKPHYTFDTFIAGESNRLAFAA